MTTTLDKRVEDFIATDRKLFIDGDERSSRPIQLRAKHSPLWPRATHMTLTGRCRRRVVPSRWARGLA